MNPHAKKYFENNPDARYWYFTHSIRIPNPKYRRDPLWAPDPHWPAAHEALNQIVNKSE